MILYAIYKNFYNYFQFAKNTFSDIFKLFFIFIGFLQLLSFCHIEPFNVFICQFYDF